MEVAVLSNINMEPLSRFLNGCYFSGFGQYLKDLKDRSSPFWSKDFDVIWLHFDVDLEPPEFISILRNTILPEVEELARKRTKTLIIFSELCFPQYHIEHFFRKKKLFEEIQYFNKEIEALSITIPNFLVLSTEYLIRKVGYSNFLNENFWYAGRIKYSLKAFESFGREIKRIYKAYKGLIKKVLIVDLDNTLWGGIIGEDGIDGILLSEDGKGKIFRDFQKNVKKLKDLGVLLCIVSKNNYSDVVEVFEKHPLMVLKLDDFIGKKINWKPKHENIKELAQELNLGLDSFVFIDDNPFERKVVREFLPEVAVPEFPEDITVLNSWFWEEVVYEYFPKLSVTKEDREKLEQYKRNIRRRELQSKLTSYEDFLKSLQINLNVYVDDGRFKTRLAQLTQKTNQFNLTTRRYTESDIENFLNSKDTIVYALEYRDVFGSEGIVGEAIVRVKDDEAVIDTFLMSCRVIGRNVEYQFLDFIINDLRKRGIKRIFGEYIPTKRNILVKDFYKKAGFTEISQNKFMKEL